MNMTPRALTWLKDAEEVEVSYGRISVPGSNESIGSDIRGEKDRVNIGGFIFHLRYSPPSFLNRLTYSLGLLNHEKMECRCDSKRVYLSKDEDGKNKSLTLNMKSASPETNQITYCFNKRDGGIKSAEGILWIDFNFPSDEN